MSVHSTPPLRPLLLAGGFAALALLSGCGRPGAGDAHASNGPPPAPEVQVAEVALQAIRPWDEFNGRIEAVESVQLRSRVSGYIERIAFAEGQEVKKGQLLFVIDQRPYRAALASAQAQLERARAAAGLAQTQDQRARQLVAENAVSREEADTRAATLAQATAQVRAAEAELATARLQLDFTEVRSPITGRASRALLTVGNMAQADQSVLTTLVSQDPVYAYFDADEHSFLRYQKAGLSGRGRAVRVALVGDSGFAHAGALDFSDNQLQPGTGTMRLRARLANPDRVLTPGLFARVQMQSGQDPQGGESQALLIDDKAVLTDQDRKYVYVVGEGNVAERRDLTLGRMVDGRRLVEKGLAAGDRLVVGGVQRIYYPGMPVNPRPVAAAAVQPVPAAAQ
ncbi:MULTISPECIES: efflux RND transporter periplasmic adaptor subunit [Comamonas]|uniref:efflux RND transporter periplasmic adaptor subunit n=1 Tax=Comamonas TaxID=283 RepID=UPI00050FBC12|nr:MULTISPECIES: efflux RND transporter periplasmic adaptor subunit [Comamonas]KGG95990.1 AcrA [Comamonas thiooxydans]KGH02374.1 AcrA [Comamonas thiooxydans]KGH09643.1 AcrA [Comamonas thiooxydans]KGH16094.1 AcrA [Comamonas thiooxydans]TZG10231.1 efflux RND transporter periplasmic adaptor subunit [Comamonas thiooxydans]